MCDLISLCCFPSSKDHPVIKFRNYQPHTEELKEKKLPRVKPESGYSISLNYNEIDVSSLAAKSDEGACNSLNQEHLRCR